VREEDCGSTRGIAVDTTLEERILETKILGRVLSEDVTLADGTVIPRNEREIGELEMQQIAGDDSVTRVRVRSVLTCDASVGICSKCYGRMMATGTMVDLGEAVGIIAAQSIGEPGTQLTMRTFHTGGVAGEDITHGLPRVVELFEARSPKGKATLARTSGVVRIAEDEGKGRVVTIVSDDGNEEVHTVPTIQRLAV